MTTVPHGAGAGNRTAILAPNWLGDAVMALPAIADMRRALPSGSLTVIARSQVAALFRMAPGIDDVAVIDEPAPAHAKVERIKRGGYARVVLLPNSFQSALLAWRAGIPERWGFRADCRALLLTRAVPRPWALHQAVSYQHLVRELGFANGPPEPQLTVSPAARAAAVELLVAAGWDRQAPLVAFAPGAANGCAKQWPTASFAEVASKMAADGITPVIVGAAGDSGAGLALIGSLDEGARRTVVNVIGRTDLPTLAGLLVHCRALVTNDSGGMHVAAALGVPVTAMFGPSREDETRPIGRSRSVVLTHPVWCRPCMLKECPIDHRCMRGISPEAVLAAARGQLHREGLEASTT